MQGVNVILISKSMALGPKFRAYMKKLSVSMIDKVTTLMKILNFTHISNNFFTFYLFILLYNFLINPLEFVTHQTEKVIQCSIPYSHGF